MGHQGISSCDLCALAQKAGAAISHSRIAISSSRNAKISAAHITCRYRVLSGILSVILRIFLYAYHYKKYRRSNNEMSNIEVREPACLPGLGLDRKKPREGELRGLLWICASGWARVIA